jgi:Zn-dependent protease with chaperone function
VTEEAPKDITDAQRERLRKLIGIPSDDTDTNISAGHPQGRGARVRTASTGRRIRDWRLSGLPPGLGTFEWLAASSLRLPAATAAALLSTWTAVIFALWIAVYSAIGSVALLLTGTAASGHIAGIFTFTEHTGVSLTVLGVLTALFAGFGIGFADSYLASFNNGLPEIALALLIGIILGMVIGLVAMVFEPELLRARGYRRPSRKEWETKLEPAVDAIVAATGLTEQPIIMVTDTPVPLAWTVTRHIVISTGIINGLGAAELQGVLCHEFAHWRRGDGIALRMVWAFSWPIAVTYNLGMALAGARYGTPQSPADLEPRHGSASLLAAVGWFFLWPSYILMRFLIGPITAHGTRAMEYEADADTVRAGFGSGLRRFLEGQPPFEPGRSAWEAVLSASHPPVQLRLEAIDDDPDSPDAPIHELSRKQAGTLVGISLTLLALFISHFIPTWASHIHHTEWWEPW